MQRVAARSTPCPVLELCRTAQRLTDEQQWSEALRTWEKAASHEAAVALLKTEPVRLPPRPNSLSAHRFFAMLIAHRDFGASFAVRYKPDIAIPIAYSVIPGFRESREMQRGLRLAMF